MFCPVAALAAVTAGMLVGFEAQLRDPAPVVSNDETVEATLEANRNNKGNNNGN
jgi:hypothetical protein